jgi:hypothetical protein
MGTRLWLALLVCLGSASAAQAVPIAIGLPVSVTALSNWAANPYPPPNDLALGDVGTLAYTFESDDFVIGPPGCSGCLGDVTLSVAPWSFQAMFPTATLAGAGNGGLFAHLRVSLSDGAVDILRLDATEDDFSFHELVLVDPTGTAIDAGDLATPSLWLAAFEPGDFSRVSWRLETQPGATAEGGPAIPEPGGATLFALAAFLVARRASATARSKS